MPTSLTGNIRTTAERLRVIQAHLKVEPDGVLGAQTLSALESVLGLTATLAEPLRRPSLGLVLTHDGISAIVRYEIGSDALYHRELRTPTWPGGESGVTIGIGYDLGYTTTERFLLDWREHLDSATLGLLTACCGKKSATARRAVDKLQTVRISLSKAKKVFRYSSLYEYARRALRAYPGLEHLEPAAQSAIVSLVFNRGVSMRGASRREMLNIKHLVEVCDHDGIAGEIESMKRIWEGRNLGGLLKRRDAEAEMVRSACRFYHASELVHL